MQQIDIILSILLVAGLGQIVWLVVMLYRRRPQAKLLANPLPPLMAIWVLFWPLYQTNWAIFVGMAFLFLFFTLAVRLRHPFFRDLQLALSLQKVGLVSLSSFGIGLFLSAALFQNIPEFGLATALAISLALPAVQWLENAEIGSKLGFPADPNQTLTSHLSLIVITALVTAFALKVYHGLSWEDGILSALLTGLAASLSRTMTRKQWQPLSLVAAMSLMLWIL
ncbi:MAG: hypothetical protein ACE5DY_03015 [Mariprofundaceae bacterium]